MKKEESGDLDWITEITPMTFERNRARRKDLDRRDKHCMPNKWDFWHKIKKKKNKNAERKQKQDIDESSQCNNIT